jgi:predicted HTH transcriptional regulator
MGGRHFAVSEEIITMLSNLGAIDENKAISSTLLKNSQQLKERQIDSEIRKLVDAGYVKQIDDKLYLTKAGLFRALSRFS